MVWRGVVVLCLLSLSLEAADVGTARVPLEDQIKKTFIDLMALRLEDAYPSKEVKKMRSAIIDDREAQLEASRNREKRFKSDLAKSRKELGELNNASSRDTSSMAEQRSEIHLRILELERGLRDEKKKQEVSIPLSSEIKLAKLRLVEEWPSQRAEISHRIESGQARDRKHGDVEDVGFRKWLQGQEKDIAVGDKAIREVKTSGRMPLETPLYSVQEYVQGLARKIAATSDLKVPLRVSVLDDPEVQSIALPGGFLFVTSGLVASARSESELAGTLAREIGKIAARHGTRSSKRAIIPKIFVPASQVATGFMTGGMTSAGAYYSMNYGFQGLGALMERAVTTPDSKLQKEADQLGIQYAWRAGFDPRGFIAFIDTITRDEDSPAAASILRTGSKFDQRMLDAFTEVQYLPPNSGTFEDSREFRMAQRALQN